MTTPGMDAGDAAASCTPVAEGCNHIDDDCDGKIDEQTQAGCRILIPHAETDCVATGAESASCVLFTCDKGFDNCDGNPTNGCEPFCMCHACQSVGDSDAGASEDDAGMDPDAG